MDMPLHIIAVGGIVENEQGEILLVKTRRDGNWVFPGGQVEVGENLIDGVIREVKEESGVDIIVSHMVGIYSNTGTYEGHSGVKIVPTKVIFDFVGQSIGGELTTSEETSDSHWVKKDLVLDYLSAPALRLRYQAYLDYDGKIPYMDYTTRPQFELKQEKRKRPFSFVQIGELLTR